MPKHYRPAGKKKEGNAAKYITRTKAVNYLQVSLAIFRFVTISQLILYIAGEPSSRRRIMLNKLVGC
ncbi:pescadillo-related [Zea mays]|uniref:Pescadillo-related n=1 Tax=Zea mays TaxID=4577 RepID=A0A1D6L0E3_MAIZE|nr:pescadillo-related [Zea mays]ONM08046.1 pescadillo-related [Zea mays]ONM08051.1 pescadillo-related [Zea mays]ONM08072.1 pescadillo-related [Zea mays]